MTNPDSTRSGIRSPRFLKVALCVIAVVAMALVMSGCRDTDALKEIIIDQNADLIDYDNPQKFYINDSTAEEESDAVSSLEVSEEDPETDEMQNLIVYSSDPNTEGFTAKHSAFSAFPDFLGIEASDLVYFYQSDNIDAFDHEVTPTPEDEEVQPPPEDDPEKLQSESNINPIRSDNTTTTTSTTTTTTTPTSSPSSGTSSSTGGSPSDSSSNAGESGEGGAGDAGSGDEPGSSTPTEEGGGAGGDVPLNDSGGSGGGGDDAGDSLIGGEGTPDADTPGLPNDWEGSGEDKPNVDDITPYNPYNPDEDPPNAQSFAAFGDYALIVQMIGGNGALAATDADTLNALSGWGVATSAAVGWGGDGSDASTIDVQAIIDSGAQYILVEDATDYARWMTNGAYDLLYNSGIQFYSMRNMCTSANIKSNVDNIGYSLQGSAVAAYGGNAQDRASEYRSRHDGMVNVNGGLASDNGSDGAKVLQYERNADGVGYSSNTPVHTVLIDYWDAGATLNLASALYSPGAAYASAGCASSPVSYYLQAGGAINTAAARTLDTASGEVPVLQFWGQEGTKSGSWSNTSLGDRIYSGGVTALLDSQVNLNNQGVGEGLGSGSFPKAVVTSPEIRDYIVSSSYDYWSLYHPYDFTSTGGQITSFVGNTFDTAYGTGYEVTCIGYDGGSANAGTPNPCYSHADGNYIDYDDILVNPRGLFGDWTSGSVESFLESGWAAARISGVYDLGQWQQYVVDFYNWAYGINPDFGVIDPN